MRHPSEGVLRRLLDEPRGVADADRQHVDGCQECLCLLAGVREDADRVASALSAGVADVDLDAAWRRLSAVPRMQSSPPKALPRSRPGRFARRPAAAALAVAVALGGAGAAAANDWLQVFRTENVAPVVLSAADLLALPDLSAYGDLRVTDAADVRQVPDAATAAAEAGLEVPEVRELPQGVVGDPEYQVGDQASATFTFSAQRAEVAARNQRKGLPLPPPGIDGSSVRLVVGPGVAQVWSSASGAPALLVGRAVAPTAYSSGVPFEVLRDYLLSLPGLPPRVAEQLRAFTADGSTLPLPLPGDEVTTRSVRVNGNPGTVVATRDRTVAGVVWVEDGVVTAVAGSLDAEEVLTVARELR
jgi:hypothetical protein